MVPEKDGFEQAKEIFDEIDRELIEAEAIKARLLNQLKTGYFNIPFRDSNGEFTVKVKMPEPDLQNRLWVLFEQITQATSKGDYEALIKLNNELSNKLALLTPDLDAAYWKRGKGYSTAVPQKILTIALGLDPVRIEELKFMVGSLVGEDFAMMLRWIGCKGPSEWAKKSDADKTFWLGAWSRFKESAKR
jgi:hypothetical protein